MSGRVPPSSRAGKPQRIRAESAEVRKAASLFQRFSGHDAEPIGHMEIPPSPRVLVAIGELDALLYTTVRDGKREKYIHHFKHSDKPVFAVSPDGRSIHILGGRYRFTERGIVDTSDKSR